MKKLLFVMIFILGGLLGAVGSWAFTNNTGNPPVFLCLDICTNALADPPVMGPEAIDVGVDLGADGTVDHWLSGELTEWLRRDAQSTVNWNGWRRYLIRLDAHAGKTAKVRIVDKSPNYYIAVKAIRLNYADGVVVSNQLQNGLFEDPVPLNHWTLLEGSVTDKTQLLGIDTDGSKLFYGNQFFTTLVNGNQDTAVVESEAFTLVAPTSFVYGMVGGGASEKWNRPDYATTPNASGLIYPPDNQSYVYLDIGTATDPPNGRYDEGVDVPVLGFSPISRGGSATDNNMHPVFLNTSGLEGRLAQVVAVDDSEVWYIQLDGWRMNWDPYYITNGGFEDIPEELKVNSQAAVDYTTLPGGVIPGWTVTKHNLPDGSPPDADISVWLYGPMNANWADQAYIGTKSIDADDVLRGVEIRSDPFVIQAIPDLRQNVFFQYNGCQGTNRKRGPDAYSTIELQVDMNGDGVFDGPEDYIYREMSQGMGWNLNTSNLDLWHYPEYRHYIKPEHYGKTARIYIADYLPSNYAWLAVDDFYFWNGSEAVKPFPNSDFEMGRAADGSIPDWTDIVISGFDDWLAATDEIVNGPNPPTTNRIMGSRYGYVDGNFAADSGGDSGIGELISVAFPIPSLVQTPVSRWELY
ncbi:MAG TPA: hypothetical protein PLH79_14090 [bacterium]|nr:hypothetical protein [bacterium]